MKEVFHSVRLDADKCQGCTNCIKRCPTGAIRIRDKKAYIIKDRCIDCGECIRICPHHAKYAINDNLNELLRYKYKVALPAPVLYGQFNNLENVDYVLTALKRIGFDDVFEVAKSAELISSATRVMMKEDELVKPVISSACPAVVRLIQTRFPNLIGNLLPVFAPVDLAAKLAREKARKDTGLDDEDIGIFFITPCPAKTTSFKNPLGYDVVGVNGSIAIKDIYKSLLHEMDNLKPQELEMLSDSGIIGVGWASSSGEAAGLLKERYLAADGVENVIKILEELEDEKLNDLDFIELNSCIGGCVGGVLTVENPFVARARIQKLRKFMPVSRNSVSKNYDITQLSWTKSLPPSTSMKLADNVIMAMKMMAQMKEIEEALPGLDCGICGAPSCRELADDIVRGYSKATDCIFYKIQKEKEEMGKHDD